MIWTQTRCFLFADYRFDVQEGILRPDEAEGCVEVCTCGRFDCAVQRDRFTDCRAVHTCSSHERERYRKLQVGGIYRDVSLSATEDEEADSTIRGKADDIQGLRPGYSDEMFTIHEIHVDLDLEGFEDMDAMGEATGIKLPYIVTMDEGSGQILSVVRNWRETDMLFGVSVSSLFIISFFLVLVFMALAYFI